MKLIVDAVVSKEMKQYLLSQEGIYDVDINYDEFFIKMNVKFDENIINPMIVMNYIKLYGDYKNSVLVEFDKESNGNFKTLKYVVDDMCCEYCYMGLVTDLFENDKVKSVKSNFDESKPAYCIEFTIEYNDDYNEEELKKYIKSKYNC